MGGTAGRGGGRGTAREQEESAFDWAYYDGVMDPRLEFQHHRLSQQYTINIVIL